MLFETIEPCKKKAGYEAVPTRQLRLNLEQISQCVPDFLPDYQVLRVTKILLVLFNKQKNYKISLFQSGKVMIHGLIKLEEAKQILNNIAKMIEI